jgi:hypothetical protein
MRIYSPVYIIIRIILYSLLIAGIFLAIRFDAVNPSVEGYFSERSLTEILQETIFFVLFIFFLVSGYRYRAVQPVTNIISLFFLMSFIREFNFLLDWWIYPVLLIFAIIVWLLIRDLKKINEAVRIFFSQPASAWFLAGLLVTFIFSRLFGQSDFWLLMYDESNYRIAKAVAEEGIELLGDSLMLVAAIEFSVFMLCNKREGN